MQKIKTIIEKKMQTRVFKCANMPYHNLVLTILCFSVIASLHEPSCTASHNGAGHSKVNFYCFSLHGKYESNDYYQR